MDSVNEIVRAIKDARCAVILPHINADGDAVGSSKAMAELLSGLGVKAVIYTEEEVERRLSFMADGILVFTGTEDEEYDLCIALDCGDEDRLGKRAVFEKRAGTVINIDHHKTNTRFGDIVMVDAGASAAGEIVAQLFDAAGAEITKAAAGYLYAAICSDTGCFAYSNTSPKTLRTSAMLMEKGAESAEIARMLFDCVPLETELLKAEITGKMHSYFGGKLRIVSVSDADAEKYALTADDVSDIVDIPRRIQGTEIAVSIKKTDGKIRVSFRSNGNADVSAAASEFGGGGHAKAAGCTMKTETIADAEEEIVRVFGGMFV